MLPLMPPPKHLFSNAFEELPRPEKLVRLASALAELRRSELRMPVLPRQSFPPEGRAMPRMPLQGTGGSDVL
jgi:hypothetical protein